jgi:hypothetical protein
MALFRSKKPAPPVEAPPVEPAPVEPFKVVANPPVIGTVPDEVSLATAHYRADAIAREIEQRRDEGRPLHDDHNTMVAEAMSHAWRLVGAGKWDRDYVAVLQARLMGA